MDYGAAVRALLAREGPLLLDGGFATELERRGFDINTHLWSAAVIGIAPEAISAVHSAFLEAGAAVIETATYQASLAGYEHAGRTDFEASMRQAIALALGARDAFAAKRGLSAAAAPAVAVSLGPVGAVWHDGSEFTGTYGLTPAERGFARAEDDPIVPVTAALTPGRQSLASICDFHRPRVAAALAAFDALASAGGGGSGACNHILFAFETVPCALEAVAIASLLHELNTDDFQSRSTEEEHPHELHAAAPAAADAAPAPAATAASAVAGVAADRPAAAGAGTGVGAVVVAWISFSCATGTTLVSGESLAAAVTAAESVAGGTGIIGFGVNCSHPAIIEACIATIRDARGPLRGTGKRRVLVYPNRGEAWDAASGEWVAVHGTTPGAGSSTSGGDCCSSAPAAGAPDATVPPAASGTPADEEWVALARRWVAAGAWAVGGCCRTTPELLAAVRAGALSLPPDSDDTA